MKTISRLMLRTCNKLFSRKRPNDLTQAHTSNIETAAQMENIQHLPDAPPFVDVAITEGDGCSAEAAAAAPAVAERPRHGGGWLLSGIISINVLILGCALVSGSVFNSVAVTAVHRQVFLIVLLLLAVGWMLFYAGVTLPRHREGVFKDSYAGPVWLRAGLLLFGFLSLVMDIFKIAYHVGYLHCDSAVKVAFPVVQALFVFIQTHFLWTHAKDCVQRHTNLTRCGLTLTISTNLVLWMAAVAEESVHQTEVPDLNISYKTYRAVDGNKTCTCSHSACDTFKEAFFYLYPFNIEYSIFASALVFVMWKNVGRPAEERSKRQIKFRPKDACFGPVAGVLVVLAGLVVFIMYEVLVLKEEEEEEEESRDMALMIYFTANVVISGLMVLSTVIGCVVYRLDHREHVSEKNPTRSLDVGLLVGASVGQFVISYFTAVAVVATGAGGRLNALDLSWAVLTVLQLGLQNYFIIEGLHREPFHVTREAALRTNAQTALREQSETSDDAESRKPRNSPGVVDDKPNWKRRVQKEVCAFLLLCNVILWIMPAFGARPQFDHPLETKFYKFTMWAAIVNIGLPFGIFYRMHSVASLFEVYLTS